jgi:hypothetical protein
MMKTTTNECPRFPPRCDKCAFGKMAGKDYFGGGSVICCRYPQELRKNGDDGCGEWRGLAAEERKKAAGH